MDDYLAMYTPTRLLYPILVLAGILVTVLSLYSISTSAGELISSHVNETLMDKPVQSQSYTGQDIPYGEASNEQRKKMLATQHIEKSRKCDGCNVSSNQTAHDSIWH
ncbi:hypothetical protein [Sulfuriferula nivalis]|uniref:Uncharacterized protein n=1 Tax=Sulfuriferula nivalis TaxID=2675298 RepID=A0A809RFN8_9PROT|nr:hypothetical protein [Sulfuriferula nivalis]BBP00649.1 hypothetical protein SFSGTM_13570 [Sulfuriferula nivalis]